MNTCIIISSCLIESVPFLQNINIQAPVCDLLISGTRNKEHGIFHFSITCKMQVCVMSFTFLLKHISWIGQQVKPDTRHVKDTIGRGTT